jgi:hypothetical protein
MRAYLKIVSLKFLQTSGAHRAKARRARSGGSFADLDTCGTAPASAATLGSPHGQSRQTRVHSGARLIEVFPETLVAAAALDAIRLGAINFDAVKQLVIAKVERRPVKLDLCDYPYLPAANVKTTSAADYMALVF